ncbi:MAG: hypothetical protein KC910_01115 [Candidatus Eremiobacteraeota bacterium]|nr:hypothetical protein [Candidatus Eremiobacteraeota bacterium]
MIVSAHAPIARSWPSARPATTKAPPAESLPAAPQDEVQVATFPKAWVGNWQGSLHIQGGANDGAIVPMRLSIAPKGPDRYSWTIQYGDQPPRPYELLTVDSASGHYVVDEKNGILIDSFLVGDSLVSQFEVGSNRITARYRQSGDQLSVEMDTFSSQPLRRSGAGNFTVDAFALESIQRANLAKSSIGS